jgi:hypothetical protein
MHATVEERCFLATTITMQERSKHASTTIEGLYFLHGFFGGVTLKTVGATIQLRVHVWSVNQQAMA